MVVFLLSELIYVPCIDLETKKPTKLRLYKVIWEMCNGRALEGNERLSYIDGDPKNCKISNLHIIKKQLYQKDRKFMKGCILTNKKTGEETVYRSKHACKDFIPFSLKEFLIYIEKHKSFYGEDGQKYYARLEYLNYSINFDGKPI